MTALNLKDYRTLSLSALGGALAIQLVEPS
jgi:hypothetical protein